MFPDLLGSRRRCSIVFHFVIAGVMNTKGFPVSWIWKAGDYDPSRNPLHRSISYFYQKQPRSAVRWQPVGNYGFTSGLPGICQAVLRRCGRCNCKGASSNSGVASLDKNHTAFSAAEEQQPTRGAPLCGDGGWNCSKRFLPRNKTKQWRCSDFSYHYYIRSFVIRLQKLRKHSRQFVASLEVIRGKLG